MQPSDWEKLVEPVLAESVIAFSGAMQTLAAAFQNAAKAVSDWYESLPAEVRAALEELAETAQKEEPLTTDGLRAQCGHTRRRTRFTSEGGIRPSRN